MTAAQKTKEAKEPHRIPYEAWASSQLSVVKYYGSCTYNGKRYALDYDNAPTKIIDGETKYFPDLVEEIKTEKKTKKKQVNIADLEDLFSDILKQK